MIASKREIASAPLAVLFVTTQFLPEVGGTEVVTHRDAQALRQRGVDARVATLRLRHEWPAAETLDGVPVRRIGGLFLRGKLRLRFGTQWLAEGLLWLDLIRHRRTYDVVHLRYLCTLARPAALAALLTRKPLLIRVGTAGTGDAVPVGDGQETTLLAGSLDPAAPFLKIPARSWAGGDVDSLKRAQRGAWLTLRLLRRRNVTFIALSTRIRTYLIENGFRPEQIVIHPNGVDPTAYAPIAANLRARALAPQTAPTIVCVARYRYQKGLDVLLHAWKAVHARMPEARLALVGGGALHAQLVAMAEALGIAASIEFRDLMRDVRPALAEADGFVLPSRYEGMPNALIEAMAAGLPCVATRVSGSEDLIEDGASGLLVPPNDPNQLATALLRVLTDRAAARAMGEAARERIVRSFNQRTLVEDTIALYTRLTGKTPAKNAISPDDNAVLAGSSRSEAWQDEGQVVTR